MRIESFSDVANKIDRRMQSVRKVEHVISEILDRVLKNQDIPIPRIEVDTDMNVNLVYDLESAPKTEEMVVLTAIFPDLTNKGGTKLKIYYYDTF